MEYTYYGYYLLKQKQISKNETNNNSTVNDNQNIIIDTIQQAKEKTNQNNTKSNNDIDDKLDDDNLVDIELDEDNLINNN